MTYKLDNLWKIVLEIVIYEIISSLELDGLIAHKYTLFDVSDK